MSWFTKNSEGWSYTLTQPISFLIPELGLPAMDVYSLTGERIASVSKDGFLVLREGYAWNGCSVIGYLIETEGTLFASALHDFLYQLAEQGDAYVVPYSQKDADRAFKRYLPWWAKCLWYSGVRVFGFLYFGDLSPSLKIEIK